MYQEIGSRTTQAAGGGRAMPPAYCHFEKRMKDEGGRMNTGFHPSSFILHPFRRSAFTLVEIMITIAIMAIVMAAAVPVFSMLRGNRSIDGAQNIIAAALSSARTQAMTTGRVTGVMFFMTADFRMNLVTVTEAQTLNGIVFLEVPAEADPLPLPSGVGCQALIEGGPDRYMGYNKFFYAGGNADPGFTNPIGGVILFERHGRIVPLPYGFRMAVNPTGKPTDRVPSNMAKLVLDDPKQPIRAQNLVSSGADSMMPRTPVKQPPPLSQLALTLYNDDDFKALGFTRRDVIFTQDVTYSSGSTWDNKSPVDSDDIGRESEAKEEGWLDNYGRLLLINRYTGTLIKGD